MTGYIMLDNRRPDPQQGIFPRRGGARLSGTCIVHTSEGNWRNGVDSLTRLVQTRADYGCYHRACDWADIAKYYPWEWETWQDTETNNWAVGIAAACKAADWPTMPADIREGYYRNLARMAADFVVYMRDTYRVTVPLRRLSGAEARARVPGFCAHGDSGLHRSDPGPAFDWALFFNYTAQALGGTIQTQSATTKEDTLSAAEVAEIKKHQTAQADRVIAYVGQVMVSGYRVGDKSFPGDAMVGITTQNRVNATLALVQQILAGQTNLTPDQIADAVKTALAQSVVSVDVNIQGKP